MKEILNKIGENDDIDPSTIDQILDQQNSYLNNFNPVTADKPNLKDMKLPTIEDAQQMQCEADLKVQSQKRKIEESILEEESGVSSSQNTS
jgi:hypothetical protein